MSWGLKAQWSGSKVEVTASHFEDLRRIMFCLGRANQTVCKGVGIQSDDDYDATELYEYGDTCYYKGVPWVCVHNSSRGNNPVESSAWRLTPRSAVYSDYNYNSNRWIASIEVDPITEIQTKLLYPAWYCLPPQVSRWTQITDTDDNGIEQGYDQILYNEYETGKLTRNNRPVEFNLLESDSLTRGRAGYELISGPIGARYFEIHPVSVNMSWDPVTPWSMNYHIQSGNPCIDSRKYDYKIQGYQSYIENFIERNAAYIWNISGSDYRRLDDRLDDSGHSVLNDGQQFFNCNYSAFEKCLELIGVYDWYLDMKYPPDWQQRKANGLDFAIKGVWRKTWRYSFGRPDGMPDPVTGKTFIWRGDKGPPPYVEDNEVECNTNGTNFWQDMSNVLMSFNKAMARTTNADRQTVSERHDFTNYDDDKEDKFTDGVANYEKNHVGNYELMRLMVFNMKNVLDKLGKFEVSDYSIIQVRYRGNEGSPNPPTAAGALSTAYSNLQSDYDTGGSTGLYLVSSGTGRGIEQTVGIQGTISSVGTFGGTYDNDYIRYGTADLDEDTLRFYYPSISQSLADLVNEGVNPYVVVTLQYQAKRVYDSWTGAPPSSYGDREHVDPEPWGDEGNYFVYKYFTATSTFGQTTFSLGSNREPYYPDWEDVTVSMPVLTVEDDGFGNYNLYAELSRMGGQLIPQLAGMREAFLVSESPKITQTFVRFAQAEVRMKATGTVNAYLQFDYTKFNLHSYYID